MSLKDKILEKVDADKNGKVSIGEVVAALEGHFGAVALRYATGGFIVGVAITFALFKMLGK